MDSIVETLFFPTPFLIGNLSNFWKQEAIGYCFPFILPIASLLSIVLDIARVSIPLGMAFNVYNLHFAGRSRENA